MRGSEVESVRERQREREKERESVREERERQSTGERVCVRVCVIERCCLFIHVQEGYTHALLRTQTASAKKDPKCVKTQNINKCGCW